MVSIAKAYLPGYWSRFSQRYSTKKLVCNLLLWWQCQVWVPKWWESHLYFADTHQHQKKHCKGYKILENNLPTPLDKIWIETIWLRCLIWWQRLHNLIYFLFRKGAHNCVRSVELSSRYSKLKHISEKLETPSLSLKAAQIKFSLLEWS